MLINNDLSIMEKLEILSMAAKYDVACTSSGSNRKNDMGGIGNTVSCGICHSFAADGRCISLLKILMTNECIFNCKYCINRADNDVLRTTFTPEEICTLTMEFYRRNYIEGLFLSSGILKSPDYTMEKLLETVRLLREVYGFNGYIHVKGIPGASMDMINKIGFYTDRMSINLELPTSEGLKSLAPHKSRKSILTPMKQIQKGIEVAQIEQKNQLVAARSTALSVRSKEKVFVPAGQSTQMIIGATPETDYHITAVAEALYKNYGLKRVFYSAFINVNEDSSLPDTQAGPPLLREHRLYQADFLMRFYGFEAKELLSEERPNFNVLLDPKCDWALRNLSIFPVEVNRADYATLLRVPGIGVTSAKRIIKARRFGKLDFYDLKKMGVVLKRALYFITCQGRMMYNTKIEENYITNALVGLDYKLKYQLEDHQSYKQLSLFDDYNFGGDMNGQYNSMCV
ncbi:MAG: putative DNA modification/repair radical SAM protein [Lachnospiraceae bacterium]|nr:putative DNA modification/repair radical SAM protein [Lachnospiraceae bacterium]